MKRFSVFISESAQAQLYSYDKRMIERIKSSLRELEADPFKSRAKADIKKLKGSRNPALYRLRIGDVRAVYSVTGNMIKVTEIIDRNRGYKWLM